MKKFWIIAIIALLLSFLYHLSAHADSFLNQLLASNWFKPGSFWPSLILMSINIILICFLSIIKIGAKLLSEADSKYTNKAILVKKLINTVFLPYFIFEFFYAPLSWYEIVPPGFWKIYLIIGGIGLILLAIWLTMKKDNKINGEKY